MRNIFRGAILTFFLASCNLTYSPMAEERQGIRVIGDFNQTNPVYKAIQYNGLHERQDRQELKEFIGIDPVRTEWCAAFVNSVLEESGIESNSEHRYQYTARAFLDWGVEVEVPKSGDIVIFPRGNQGWQGHVGFYIKTEYIDGVEYYWILGGNQRGKVSFVKYRSSRKLGIRRQK